MGGGITAVHAQLPVGDADGQPVNGSDPAQNPIVANDDTAISNGIDELAIDILANDIFEGPVSVRLEPDYVEIYRPELVNINGTYAIRNVTRYGSQDVFYDRYGGDQIIKNFGHAAYNGTHLVYAPSKHALSGTVTLVSYTYTIQDGTGRSDSANVTMRITRPVASAAVSSSGPDTTFLITAYSTDPISGRILDEAGSTIYNFTGIKPAVANDWHNIYVRPTDPPDRLETPKYTLHGIEVGTLGHPFDCYPDRATCARSIITGAIPEFDAPLEQGTYTYQFARTADTGYSGGDVYNGTFTVHEPSEPAPKIVNPDPSNRNPVARDFIMYVQHLRLTHLHGQIPDAMFLRPPVQDPDGDNATITSVAGATLGRIFDQYLSRGTIVYIPGGSGTDIINYTASDGRGGADTGRVFIRTPSPDNRDPVLNHIFSMGVRAGQDLRFTASATDADGDPLTFDIANAPDGAAINSTTGDFSWTPTALQNGTHTVTIIVYDSRGGDDWQNVALTALLQDGTNPAVGSTVAAPVNDTAVGRMLEAYMSRGLVAYAGILPVSGDAVNAALPGAARHVGLAPGFLLAGIIINATGADGAKIADYALSDVTDQNDIAVSISEIGNVPPVLSEIGDYTINAHDTLTFSVPATDFGGTISYLLLDAPGHAAISEQGIFRWRPGSDDVDTHTFTIIAYDGYGAHYTEPVTIHVLPAGTPNDPPSAPDVTATVAPDGRILIIPAISDPDGDPTHIATVTGDAGGTLIPSGNGIEYTAGPNPGTETVTYAVRDSRGAGATGTIMITIR